MNTKPKAMKFRIRRSSTPVSEGAAAAAVPPSAARAEASPIRSAMRPEPTPAAASRPASPPPHPLTGANLDRAFEVQNDGFGAAPYNTARTGAPANDAEAELEAIRREGLTGRQLRMARRVAQKHGIEAETDFDAVRLLRKRGIDPFARGNMLELVIANAKGSAGAEAAAGNGAPATGKALAPIQPNLPQKAPSPQTPAPHMPGMPGGRPQPMSEEARAKEIRRIQRDIARRRRGKLGLLFVRLAIFVLLPTLLGGLYYSKLATPLYATKSEFVIQKADGGGGGGGLGGLLSGSGLGGSQDSITVQSYLTSRDAMLRLDEEHGFRAHFSQEHIDPVKRLPPDATNEQAYRLYTSNVKIGFDPTEGIIRMEVIAADPETSQEFSVALINYAEEQVDHLSARLRGDQMEGAQQSFLDAEQKMMDAQAKVLALQEKLGVLDPAAEAGSLMSEISQREAEMRQKQLELQGLLDNARPNQARVDGLRADISRIQAMVNELRARLTQSSAEKSSMAQIVGELRIAEADLATRQTMMTAALQQLESARIEANKQVRYLAVGVRPVAPDEATYPRKFENTLLVFFIFSGIYLMISLTASILREQVSA